MVRERSWIAGGLALVVLTVAAAIVVLTRSEPLPAGLVTSLRAVGVAVAALLAVVARLHWRATGRALGGRLSTSAWLLAGAGVLGLVIGEVATGPSVVWLRVALTVAAAVWLAWGVAGPEVDADARPGVELLVALGVAATTGLLLGLVLPAASFGTDGVAAGVIGLLVGMLWAGVAALGLVRAVERSSLLVGWVSWLALAFAAVELARFAAVLHLGDWLILAAVARVSGLLIATVGLCAHLTRSTIDRRGELHHSRLARHEAERAQRDRERERSHEVRNALFAIEGASSTLERFRGELDERDQRDLATAVAEGIGHLRGLFEPRPVQREPVDLWRLASGHAALLRARGIPATVEGHRHHIALGDEGRCTQVIENLLANAVRHGNAADRGLTLRVGYEGGRVVLRVSDEGSGVPPGQEDRIFDRGVRLRPDREGEGLGLAIARGLAREQGGDLWVEPRTVGAGACFVFGLPGVGAGGVRHEMVDEGERLTQIGQDERRAAVGEGRDATALGGRSVVEAKDDAGRDRRPVTGHDGEIEPVGDDRLDDQGDLDAAGQQRPQALGE